MEQIIEISDERVEAVEDQQLVELPVDLLDKVGGGVIPGMFL
ncbi:hypothetical protein SBBP2_350006 [Burkholderiales bacterium]|jgi:hypothetical protein|nr:hypothetical protein SBBP2_350006 [Burkholderiales bacterium]